MISLFRALLPSWRFFDRAGDVVHLSYRIMDDQGQPGEWLRHPRPPPRPWKALVHNPEGNLFLASQATVDRLADELSAFAEDPSRLSQTVSYRVVEEMVRFEIRRTGVPSGRVFQFKLGVARGENPADDLLLSTDHEV